MKTITIVTVAHFKVATIECTKNKLFEKTYGLFIKDSSIEFSKKSKAPERKARRTKDILAKQASFPFFRARYEIKDARNKEYENA